MRPALDEFGEEWDGDAVAALVYETLCDRGMEPSAAAEAMAERYDYEPFGRLVEEIQRSP